MLEAAGKNFQDCWYPMAFLSGLVTWVLSTIASRKVYPESHNNMFLNPLALTADTLAMVGTRVEYFATPEDDKR